VGEQEACQDPDKGKLLESREIVSSEWGDNLGA
jgi:hypothetical protein